MKVRIPRNVLSNQVRSTTKPAFHIYIYISGLEMVRKLLPPTDYLTFLFTIPSNKTSSLVFFSTPRRGNVYPKNSHEERKEVLGKFGADLGIVVAETFFHSNIRSTYGLLIWRVPDFFPHWWSLRKVRRLVDLMRVMETFRMGVKWKHWILEHEKTSGNNTMQKRK